MYGAFLGTMSAFLVLVAIRKLPLLAMADLIAPSLAVGLAIGRVGCFLNGCCYGGESSVAWAVAFPGGELAERASPPYADQARQGRLHGLRVKGSDKDGGDVVVIDVDPGTPAAATGLLVGDSITSINGYSVDTVDEAGRHFFESLSLARQSELSTPLQLHLNSGEVKTIDAFDPPERSLRIHPTQLYSAVNGALLAWLLWTYFPLRRRDGEVIALLMTLYPIARFSLESVRVDESEVLHTGLTVSQNISIGIFLFAVAFLDLAETSPAAATPAIEVSRRCHLVEIRQTGDC